MLAPTRRPALADAWRSAGHWRGETIWQAFAATTGGSPDAIAVIDGRTRTTFAALGAEA